MADDDVATARRRRIDAQFARGNPDDEGNIYASKAALSMIEEDWRDRQVFLESKGYILRPRLRPGWIPSWTAVGGKPRNFEDSIHLPVSKAFSPRIVSS